MNRQGHDPKWVLLALFFATAVTAVLMYGLGKQAENMPEYNRQMNKLLHDQTINCSGKKTAQKCRDTMDAIEAYTKAMSEEMTRKAKENNR